MHRFRSYGGQRSSSVPGMIEGTLQNAIDGMRYAQGKSTRLVLAAEEIVMDSIIYVVGAVVIIMAIVGYLGLA